MHKTRHCWRVFLSFPLVELSLLEMGGVIYAYVIFSWGAVCLMRHQWLWLHSFILSQMMWFM